jgi:ATP-binding cassette subfamily G (WHITE) protein 2 (SNQ2)
VSACGLGRYQNAHRSPNSGGIIFVAILQAALQSLSETTASFNGRQILAKHQALTLYRPTALFIAQTIADLPMFFFQFLQFTVTLYYMSGLRSPPSYFFIFFLFIYVTTISMTALFRTIGNGFPTFQDATKVSGTIFFFLVLYAVRVLRRIVSD